MATRCIIAEPHGDGWRGRYSHWDGYPSAKLPQLFALVARDGVETVRKVLLHDNYSWSSINPDCQPETDESITNDHEATGRKLVAGYGEAHYYLVIPPDFFTQSETDFAWAEFLYILGDSSVMVFSASNADETAWSFVDEYRYDVELSFPVSPPHQISAR